MSFFDDENDEDPFDSLLKDFFGGSRVRKGNVGNGNGSRIIKGEEEEREIDFIETDKKVYLIFELPGFSEKDVKVEIKGKVVEILCKSKNKEVQSYLAKKMDEGIFLRKTLPSFIKSKYFKHTMRNGILEVVFDKK